MPYNPRETVAVMKTWAVVILLVGTMAYAVAENLTLTTYYPSPRGMYKELRTTDATYLATDTASATSRVGIGTTTPRGLIDAPAGLYLNTNAGSPTKNDMANFGRTGANIELFGANGTDGGGGGHNQQIFIDANNGIYFRTDDTPGPQATLMTITSNGSVGIGTTIPGIAKTYISNDGTNVGLYVGNGTPFGQAKLEIDGPAATHIWVAEGGNRVFSVSAGGTITTTGNADITGTVIIRGGAPATGKVLVTDNAGNASWAYSMYAP